MVITTLTGSAQKERNLIPVENAQGRPGSKSWARAGSSDPKPTAKTPSCSRAGSEKGTRSDWWVLGFSALIRASDPRPAWQETGFCDGFPFTAQFGRTDALGQAGGHKFLGNNS